MTDPERWTDGAPDAPDGAAELLGALSAPPPLPETMRAESAARLAELIRTHAPEPSWRLVALAASFALLALGVGYVVRALDQDETESAPGHAMARLEPESTAPLAPDAAAEAPRAPGAPTSSDGGPPDGAPESAPSTPVPPTTPAKQAPQPTKQSSHTTADASSSPTGWITVVTTPWSTVYVDGRRVGQTPLIKQQVPVGVRHLRFHRDGEAGRANQVSVQVEEDTVTRLRLSLPLTEAVEHDSSPRSTKTYRPPRIDEHR